MDYYRKAVAVFIVFIALILPFHLETEEKVALVEINTVIKKSSYLSSVAENSRGGEAAEKEILKIIKVNSAEYAEKNNYSSVITKHLIYKGGEDITANLAKKIDSEK